MSSATSMTKLLDKIERRLGTAMLNLPPHLNKTQWGKVIEEDTLDTFSRFFPHKILYKIDTQKDKGSDGFYYIDEDRIPGDVTIYGVRDLALEKFATSHTNPMGGGTYDIYNLGFSFENMAMAQMNADMASMYDNGIYVEFEYPNRISIKNTMNQNLIHSMREVDIWLFIKHSKNLATISPTKMEAFEKLAILDVKIFLYEGLKHFDGLETVYSNIDLKIADWASADNERDSMVDRFKDEYISASNTNQPMFYCV